MKITTYYRHLLIIFSIVVIVSCVCAVKQASAQAGPAATAIDEIKPLKIGDKVPDELWNRYFPVVSAGNDQTQMLSLGDFRDKLIILDFWATWCAPCISSLGKLDTLQSEFGNDLVIIPTSYEPEEKVRKFFIDKGWQLPTLFNETLLKAYFPYRSIPHQVWIRDGKVLAITGPEYTSGANIDKVIKNETIKLYEKNETLKFNKLEPLLLDDNGGDQKEMLIYQSMLTKRMNASVSGISKEGRNNILIYNYPLGELFKEAFLYDFPKYAQNDSRVKWEVPDEVYRANNLSDRKKTGEYENDKKYYAWLAENVYCYNLVFPEKIPNDMVYSLMREDLNNVFKSHRGVQAAIEKRKVSCLVLDKLKNYKPLTAKGEKRSIKVENGAYKYRSWTLDEFAHTLSNYYSLEKGIPIINNTHITDKVDMDLNLNTLNDLDVLNKALNRVGLSAKIKEEMIDMLVIKLATN